VISSPLSPKARFYSARCVQTTNRPVFLLDKPTFVMQSVAHLVQHSEDNQWGGHQNSTSFVHSVDVLLNLCICATDNRGYYMVVRTSATNTQLEPRVQQQHGRGHRRNTPTRRCPPDLPATDEAAVIKDRACVCATPL
jgi:hypothetical protein